MVNNTSNLRLSLIAVKSENTYWVAPKVKKTLND